MVMVLIYKSLIYLLVIKTSYLPLPCFGVCGKVICVCQMFHMDTEVNIVLVDLSNCPHKSGHHLWFFKNTRWPDFCELKKTCSDLGLFLLCPSQTLPISFICKGSALFCMWIFLESLNRK